MTSETTPERLGTALYQAFRRAAKSNGLSHGALVTGDRRKVLIDGYFDLVKIAEKALHKANEAREFPPEYAGEDGWTDSIHPLPDYLMKCCGCGCIHKLELRIDDAGRPNFRMGVL